MSDNKCPSCGAPMKLGARECGYCDYVTPAPKATEMSADQKKRMVELKQMLSEQYEEFKLETWKRSQIRVFNSMNIGWWTKKRTGAEIVSLDIFGEGAYSFEKLNPKVIYFEDGHFITDGFCTRFVNCKKDGSASESLSRELDEKISEQKLGLHASDFPTEREFIQYRMKEIQTDQALIGGGDDIII
jgi:hypothetical protein